MANMDSALKRDSMADRVKQSLLERIMSGELPPGHRLVELQIAHELNTSQGPVREALCELESLDLIVTEPYKGSRVRELTSKDIREAYLVRAALENLAGQLAAPRFKGSSDPLKKIAAAILEAARKKDVGAYARHDIQFHRSIVEGAANRILLRTWNSLAFEVRLQFKLSKGNVDLTALQEAHWEIIEALEQGHRKRAGQLLQDHILQSASEEPIQNPK